LVFFGVVSCLLGSERCFVVGLNVVDVFLKVRDLLGKVGLGLQLDHDLIKGADVIDGNHSLFSFFLELFVEVVEAH
jgi:hypothetical protein